MLTSIENPCLVAYYVFLTLLLPTCHNVDRFVASFLVRCYISFILSHSYRVDGAEINTLLLAYIGCAPINEFPQFCCCFRFGWFGLKAEIPSDTTLNYLAIGFAMLRFVYLEMHHCFDLSGLISAVGVTIPSL